MSKYCTMDDEVVIDHLAYKIEVCITAPEGEVVDDFLGARILGLYKKQLDEDFAAESNE